MKILIAFTLVCVCSCQTKKLEQKTTKNQSQVTDVSSDIQLQVVPSLSSFEFDRSDEYSIAPAIPEGDKWLRSYQKGNGYKDGWETWVWRLTDIKIAEGLKVYARGDNETQFLIRGCEEYRLICVNFSDKVIGEGGFFSGSHQVALSPSKKYLVCITGEPKAYLHNGVSLDSDKSGSYWKYTFEGDVAKWWRVREKK